MYKMQTIFWLYFEIHSFDLSSFFLIEYSTDAMAKVPDVPSKNVHLPPPKSCNDGPMKLCAASRQSFSSPIFLYMWRCNNACPENVNKSQMVKFEIIVLHVQVLNCSPQKFVNKFIFASKNAANILFYQAYVTCSFFLIPLLSYSNI